MENEEVKEEIREEPNPWKTASIILAIVFVFLAVVQLNDQRKDKLVMDAFQVESAGQFDTMYNYFSTQNNTQFAICSLESGKCAIGLGMNKQKVFGKDGTASKGMEQVRDKILGMVQ